MRLLTLAAATLLLFAAAPVPAQSQSIFDLPTGRPQRAIVTLDEARPEIEEGLPWMALALSGVIADLKGKELAALRATAPPNPPLGDASEAERVCTIHLDNGREFKRLDIYRKDADYIAVAIADGSSDPAARAELRADAFAQLYHSWTRYRGDYTSSAGERGRTVTLDQPYTPGQFILDKATISARLLGGAAPKDEHEVRDLSIEKLTIRVPEAYSPREPAGLLVWVDAGPDGTPPAAYSGITDDLNFITIGAARSGNQRNLYSRIQLALDAVATASERYHIDPRRVYIYGISGGGRVASIAQVCFPDLFTGAIPIVGLSCYTPVPNGLGQYYRHAYLRPGTAIFRLARERPIAPMTGRNDANQLEITNATEIMRRDGLTLKLFDHPTMGHELPKPDQFREALLWVDEPYREARAKEAEAAAKLLDTYTTRAESRPPATPQERSLLLKVMEAGPWTPSAWEAWELLSGAPEPAAR